MIGIKGFTPRRYQETILNTSAKNNTLIVLPTGLGKTKTAILIAVQRLNTYPKSKVLFLTPTKPLAAQIQKEFQMCTTLEESQVRLFTGNVKPSEREKLWQEAKVIVSTPQGCSNDIISKKINIEDVSCLILDEVHHALGNYDYCFIAKNYNQFAKFPRIIGLTASPGSDSETIEEICRNTYIESVESRTHEDEDVREYVHHTELDYVMVELPEEIKEVRKMLQECLKRRLQKLKDLGATTTIDVSSKGALLTVQKEVQGRIIRGEKDHTLWSTASTVAEAIKIFHALELAETQGTTALSNYFKKIYEEAGKTKTKATKNVAADEEFRKAYLKTTELRDKNIEHPKIDKMKELVKAEVEKDPKSKIIIFNNYRDSGMKLMQELNSIPNVTCGLFVGQTKKGETGMSQKNQIKMLEDFKEGKFNAIVATSVGEEGLDIASVNLVIFYEPVPSAIRSIQRKGRTARLEKGAVKILVTKNTRDEVYRWTSHHKEKKMHSILSNLKNKIKLERQQPLAKFAEDGIKIYADTREANSGILKELSELGMDIKIQQLNAGDFLISDRVCVERKSVLRDTPVIIKIKDRIRILPIKEAYNLFHKKKIRFKTKGIDFRSNNINWFDVYDVTRHVSKEIYHLSFAPKRQSRRNKENFNIGLTGSHNVYVFRKKRITCIPTSELKNGDYLIIVSPKLEEAKILEGFSFSKFLDYVQSDSIKGYRIKGKKFRLNSTKTWYKAPILDENFFFLVGLWVADGSYTNASPVIAQKSKERNNIIENILLKVTGNFRIGVDQYSFGGKVYRKFFKEMGLNSLAENKNIPPLLFNASNSLKAAFIRGYFFGDGWVSHPKIRKNPQIKAISKSKNLICELSYLLYSLGIQNRVYTVYKNYKREKRKYYELSIKTVSLQNFIKVIGQIPTKEIKTDNPIGRSFPYFAMLETTRRLYKLEKKELLEFYNEVDKLRGAYMLLRDYLSEFKEVISNASIKKGLSERYQINYSTLRNITNSRLKTTTYPLKIINILREKKGMPQIYINFKIIKKYLKKLRIRTYLEIYPKIIESEYLIKNIYEKIDKTIGFDSLFLVAKSYSDELFLERISSIRKSNKTETVYDLSVKNSENFVGGKIPILLHNTASDFVNSIIDKRLLHQLKALKDNFERAVLILEGTEDIYSIRNIHPNAIRGMLATIAVDYGIPIVYTKDYRDTAALLRIMAKHEQEGEQKDFGVRTEKKPLTTKEQQEFVIESLPGVGATLAKSLLKEFKTIKSIVNATEEDLQKIDKLGKKKATEIQRIVEEKYEGD